MNSSVPIPHKPASHYHESSPLRPHRDSDNVQRSWQRNRTDASQIGALSRSLTELQREVNRMRRFMGSEAEEVTGGFRGEWVDQAYEEQEIVIRGILGTFVAVSAVPAGTPPETGAPYWVALVWPSPGVWG